MKRGPLVRAWVPSAIVIVVVGAAGVLGGVQASGQAVPTVASILSATRQAGTVRYAASSIRTSTNPLLRGSLTTTAQVNFATGDSTMTLTQRGIVYQRGDSGPVQTEDQTDIVEQRQVAGQQYIYFGATPGFPSFDAYWMKSPGRQFVKGLIASLGPEYLGLLILPPDQLALVREGSAIIHGVPVTAYLVQPTTSLIRCTGFPFGSNGQPVRTEVWVDAQERLRAVQTSITDTVKPPKDLPALQTQLAPYPTGRMTTRTNLRIISLGSPVQIAAPPLGPHNFSSSTFVVATRPGCQ